MNVNGNTLKPNTGIFDAEMGKATFSTPPAEVVNIDDFFEYIEDDDIMTTIDVSINGISLDSFNVSDVLPIKPFIQTEPLFKETPANVKSLCRKISRKYGQFNNEAIANTHSLDKNVDLAMVAQTMAYLKTNIESIDEYGKFVFINTIHTEELDKYG